MFALSSLTFQALCTSMTLPNWADEMVLTYFDSAIPAGILKRATSSASV